VDSTRVTRAPPGGCDRGAKRARVREVAVKKEVKDEPADDDAPATAPRVDAKVKPEPV
jgi:hypothetical protein